MSYQLYTYDHCPYCVKARMIFGLKNISFEHIILLNDDEKTPISMIGAKMVPILKKENEEFIGESLDIIRYIDEKTPPQKVVWKEDEFLINQLERASSYCYFLAMPRWVQSEMEEFKTPSARHYFQKKKENMIGSFSKALDQTESFKKNISPVLEILDQKISGGQWYLGDKLSVNDFHLFPFLRSLTILKGFSLPENLDQYAEKISQKTGIPLSKGIAL